MWLPRRQNSSSGSSAGGWPLGDELLAPRLLLHLRAVGGPQRLAYGLQAIEDRQRLLGCPLQWHDWRGGCRWLHRPR